MLYCRLEGEMLKHWLWNQPARKNTEDHAAHPISSWSDRLHIKLGEDKLLKPIIGTIRRQGGDRDRQSSEEEEKE